MSSRRQKSARTESMPPVPPPQSYQELAQAMREVRISRIDEMPRIELYLDQVLSLVSLELAPFYPPGEKILTGSMVNNYVKQHIIPAPVRKRYMRRHIAWLIFVCMLKRVLPIAQVARISQMIVEADLDLARAYDELVGTLEQLLVCAFPPDERACGGQGDVSVRLYTYDGTPHDDLVNRLLEDGLVMVARRVHTDHLLALSEKAG